MTKFHAKVAVALFLSSTLLPITSPAAGLPIIPLTIGKETIQVEVATTPSSQALGLMYRKTMPESSGMLFVFQQKAGHCFWMKNTDLPIAIAFLEDDGKIINIEEMQAQTEDNHCPAKATRFALEMNAAWFSKRNIRPGKVVEGLPKF